MGQEIYDARLNTRSINQIDLSGFPKGVYFICPDGDYKFNVVKIARE